MTGTTLKLQKRNRNYREYGRFAITGLLNTAIDFGVFNILLYVAGPIGRSTYILFKGISFCAAVANSYILNRRWVFPHALQERGHKQKVLFFVASGIGFLLNVIVALVVFSTTEYLFPNLGNGLSANIGAVVGAFVTKIWNFLSYKYLVFRVDAI